MIDLIKVYTKDFDKKHLEQILDFKGQYTCSTGEVFPVQKAKYKNLEFIIYDSGLLIIKGSLHKYKNKGEHNYDDFSFNQIATIVDEISTKFKLNPKKCELKNLEIGINLIFSLLIVKKVLNNLIFHKNMKFKDVSRSGGHIMQAEHKQYIFKIYNKGLQFNLPYELIRIELKFTRMEKLNKIGIRTLADLKNKELYVHLRNILLDEWNSILLYELVISESTKKKNY